MSMRSLEAAILAELRTVTGNTKLRQNDIQEWSTSKVEARDGETLYFLPVLSVHVAVKVPPKKTKAKPEVKMVPCEKCKDPVREEEFKCFGCGHVVCGKCDDGTCIGDDSHNGFHS